MNEISDAFLKAMGDKSVSELYKLLPQWLHILLLEMMAIALLHVLAGWVVGVISVRNLWKKDASEKLCFGNLTGTGQHRKNCLYREARERARDKNWIFLSFALRGGGVPP